MSVINTSGRRKTSVARVYMTKGKGVFTVNKKPMDEYFGRETSSMIINQPLDVVEMHNKFDFNKFFTNQGCKFNESNIKILTLNENEDVETFNNYIMEYFDKYNFEY